VQHGAVHGVHQAEHVVLQDQVHVFALDSTRKHAVFLEFYSLIMFMVTCGHRFEGQEKPGFGPTVCFLRGKHSFQFNRATDLPHLPSPASEMCPSRFLAGSCF
jgi:hypothetical protein